MKAALKTEKHSVKDLFSFVESKGQRGVEFGLLVCLLLMIMSCLIFLITYYFFFKSFFNDYVMSSPKKCHAGALLENGYNTTAFQEAHPLQSTKNARDACWQCK